MPKKEKSTKAPKDPQVFDSLKAASSALNIPLPVLKRLKRAGAPGFRGSRVYAAELPNAETIKEQFADVDVDDDGAGKESLEKRKLRIQCDKLEFTYAVTRGEYARITDIEKWATELAAAFSLELDSVPPTLAPDVVGCRTIADAEAKIRAALDRVKQGLHSNPWKKK